MFLVYKLAQILYEFHKSFARVLLHVPLQGKQSASVSFRQMVEFTGYLFFLYVALEPSLKSFKYFGAWVACC